MLFKREANGRDKTLWGQFALLLSKGMEKRKKEATRAIFFKKSQKVNTPRRHNSDYMPRFCWSMYFVCILNEEYL